ncbi:MAG: hypothetical protein J5966_04290 [Lachnospiraceae bacterium]|nr:hypothetical protein [Lachnospiraceae bacterium]
MSSKDFESIQDIARQRVSDEIGKFVNGIKKGTADPDNYMSIFELEKLWGHHKAVTSQIYSDTLSDLLDHVNQEGLIKSKKENTGKRG